MVHKLEKSSPAIEVFGDRNPYRTLSEDRRHDKCVCRLRVSGPWQQSAGNSCNEERGFPTRIRFAAINLKRRQPMIRSLITALALLAFTAMPVCAETAPTPAPKATPKAAPKATQKQAPVGEKVNLNSASAEELDKLPQIGPARAKAIIEARAKGAFKNWDDFVARKVVP